MYRQTCTITSAFELLCVGRRSDQVSSAIARVRGMAPSSPVLPALKSTSTRILTRHQHAYLRANRRDAPSPTIELVCFEVKCEARRDHCCCSLVCSTGSRSTHSYTLFTSLALQQTPRPHGTPPSSPLMSPSTRRSATALAFLSFFAAARAQITPTAPGPGAVFRVGGSCSTQWTLDPSKVSAALSQTEGPRRGSGRRNAAS